MTTLTENTRKILSPFVVLAVLLVSIALFFYAAAPLAVTVPLVGWILLALVAIGALALGWFAWDAAAPRPAAKVASKDPSVAQSLLVALESFTVAVAILGALAWLAPAMGLPTALAAPFALGLVSILALLLDFLSKTGKLTERWRSLEVGTTVFVTVSIVAALFYLAVGA